MARRPESPGSPPGGRRFLPAGGAGRARGPLSVAAIQGDVPHARNLPDLLRATTVTQNHASRDRAAGRAGRSGARPAPDLVIWPENSTDLDPRP